jgi:hypothetical protein
MIREMTLYRRAPVLITVALLGLLLVPPAKADTPIATVSAPTSVSAHGGRLVWSAYDPVARRYSLATRFGGAISLVPVEPRSVPFDVDLGPNAAGATVAVYSRCPREPDPPKRATGCDIYEFDFASSRERKLNVVSRSNSSDFAPSISGIRIAFARLLERRSKKRGPYLYVASTKSGRVWRVPHGTTRGCYESAGGRICSTFRQRNVTALDLSGRWLGFAWSYQGFGEGADYELWLDDVVRKRGRRIARGGTGLSSNVYGSPAIDGGALFFAQACFGDFTGCAHRSRFHSYEIATRSRSVADAPTLLVGHTRSAGTTFYVRPTLAPGAPYPQSCGGREAQGICTSTIFQADPIAFK